MIPIHPKPRWWPFWLGFAGALLATFIALTTQIWSLSALTVGMVFGFLIQKGELCGAAAFSEILMNRDGRKLGGIWMAVVVSMPLFALAHQLGWVPLNPKPLLWWNWILGGLVFGVGTVLAGGCISGCLYKASGGNFNSILALLTIPLGIALVESGPLSNFSTFLKQFKAQSSAGGSVTLPSLTGLSYGIWAVGLLAISLGFLFWRLRQRPVEMDPSSLKARFAGPWKPWKAGIALGVLALFAFLSAVAAGRNYPMGITHGVLHLHLAVTDGKAHFDWGRPKPPEPSPQASAPVQQPGPSSAGNPSPALPKPPAPKKLSGWLMLAVMGILWGAHAGWAMAGQARLQAKAPVEMLLALLGGLLVGIGAGIATGCMVGNGLSGWALLSVGTFLFGLFVLLGNWLTTHFYLMGGRLSDVIFTFSRVFKKSNLRRNP